MTLAPKTREAFDELLATLAEIRDDYVNAPDRAHDQLEAVEGYRYALQLLSEATELLAEGDPERPRFTSMVDASRKFLGDNPDAIYYQAWIRGDRSYRVRGRMDAQSYLSFTVHGPDPAGGINGPVQADVNDSDITMGPDGSFELILSAEEHPGNWVKLQPDSRFVFVRNYYLRARSAQTDPDVHIYLEIEPLDDPGPAPVLDDASYASRLREATGLVRAATLGLRVFGAPPAIQVPFVATEPNNVGTPWSFRASAVDAAGGVDIYYSSGTFELAPDEALVMEGTLPPSRFTNVMLWNTHMQTLEYRSRQSSLNSEQLTLEPNGTYRIVISAQDPGVPNWIDTEGHRRGTIFWRFVLPKEQPETPRCTVVPVSALR